MSDDFPLSGVDLFAPRADFTGTRPLIWSASHVHAMDLSLCRALVQPALRVRLEFKPDASRDEIHALQRELAFLLESTGLLGAYADDEQYLVIGLLRSIREDDGEAIATWLSEQDAVAVVRYSDVQMLAQLLANVCGREFEEDEPMASAQWLSLIRHMEPDWHLERWSTRQGEKAQSGEAGPASGEEAAS